MHLLSPVVPHRCGLVLCAAAADGGVARWVIQIQGSAGTHARHAPWQQLSQWQGLPIAYPLQEG